MDALPKAGTPSTRHRTRTNAQAAVEFALIAPIFLLILLIAVDFGRLFFTYIQLSNTAREAAAYAAINPTTDNATLTTVAMRESNVQAQQGQGAISAAAACTDSAGTTIACVDAGGGTGAGNRVIATVHETFTFFTPLIGNFWPGGLQVATSATAPVYVFAPGGGTPPAPCTTLPPTPTFTWQSPDPVNQPNLISVDATGSPNLPAPCQIVGYDWDFGGASKATGDNDPREGITQDYEYLAGGTYTVQVTVTNAAGEASSTQTITVGTTSCLAPTASFTVTPANGQAANGGGQQATPFSFDGTHSSFMTDPACHPQWAWNFGDTTTASTSQPTHKYAHAYHDTTVHVTLTVTNDAGTNTSAPVDIPLS